MGKTGVFAAAVAVLVAVTYYFEFYQASKSEEKKETEAKIIPYAVDQVHQLLIENEFGKVLLKRDPDGWRLEEPVKDWADNQFVEDFVSGLGAEKAIEVAAEGDSVQWPVFGLDKGTSKVTFTNQQGNSTLITVSDKKNFEGNSFVRRNAENKVLVATSQWPVRTKRKPIEFREKRLFRGKISSVDEITIHSSQEQFKLVRKDTRWIAEKNPSLSLDQNRVREILTSLNETQAAEYIDSIPAAAVFKASIGLKLGDKNWSAELRQSPDKAIYAHTTDPEFFMKMQPGQSDKLFDMTLMNLRNRKEPFDFQNLKVNRIEIQTNLKKSTLVKSGADKNTWTVEGDPKAALDVEAVKNLVSRLSDSAVTEYLLPAEARAFKDPANKMILKDDQQKVLFEISWGPTVKRKIPTGEKTLVLAKTSLFNDAIGLDPSVVQSWGLENLFVLQNQKPEASPSSAQPKEVSQ